MIWYILLIVGIAVVFYGALPTAGAFLVRGRWRTFRRNVAAASRYPTLGPQALSRERARAPGLYRIFGSLEAIQGDDRIWIASGRYSAAADLRGVHVFLMPDTDSGEAAKAEVGLRSVPWSMIHSLPEGTPIFIAGALFAEEGRGVFKDHGRTRLLVVIHDCPRESIMLRAIESGRQRNEYMNPFTLPSVAIGSLLLILTSFSLLSSPERILPLLALTAGLLPVFPFLPPGFPLYFAYRSFWKRARTMRVQRDTVRLPLRYFPGSRDKLPGARGSLLPDIEPYLMIRGALIDQSIVAIGMPPLALPPGMRKIEVLLTRPSTASAPGDAAQCVAFTGYREEGDGIVLVKPDDPMAEHVLVPGDPETIARASELAALRFEALSALCIGADVAINAPIVFLLLSLLFR
jgi:hypothetical protein